MTGKKRLPHPDYSRGPTTRPDRNEQSLSPNLLDLESSSSSPCVLVTLGALPVVLMARSRSVLIEDPGPFETTAVPIHSGIALAPLLTPVATGV